MKERDDEYSPQQQEQIAQFEEQWRLWRKTKTGQRPKVKRRLLQAEAEGAFEDGPGPDLEAFVARILYTELYHRHQLGEWLQQEMYSWLEAGHHEAVIDAFDELPAQSAASTLSVGEKPMNNWPQLPKFELLEWLGEGAFGEVYKARDIELDRLVAIKVLHSKFSEGSEGAEHGRRLKHEAQNQAKVGRDGVVSVYGFTETTDGRPCIISQFIDGENLQTRLESEGKLPIQRAVWLISDVAESLHAAHQAGLIHRDIKPANLLIDRSEKIWIADLGLALRDEDWTTAPELAGTPRYMSPEQARGKSRQLDARSDLFSLGLVLMETVTGKCPFRHEDREKLLDEIANGDVRPLRQLDDTMPEVLERICSKATARDIDERYSTAKDFADDLRRFLAEADKVEHQQAKLVGCDPTPYLEWLHRQTAFIDIRGLQVGTGKVHRFPIEDLYIPLTTSGVGEAGEDHEQTGAGKEFGPADRIARSAGKRAELNAAFSHRCLAVVGDPGSGKTTFLLRTAAALCRAILDNNPTAAQSVGLKEPLFPLFIRLSDLAAHISKILERNNEQAPTLPAAPRWLIHFLAHTGADFGLDEDFFREKLQTGRAILLLDGLDEAPTPQQRDQLTTLIHVASQLYSKCPFVVTTRPAAYVGEAIIPDFNLVRIEPLEDAAIETFFAHWSRALFVDDVQRAKSHQEELLYAVQSRRSIRKLAANPVMLTALAVVHWNEMRIPEQRAELYESILTWLSRSRQQRPGRPSPENCVLLLQALALYMQNHHDGRKTQVAKHWAAEQIASEFREVAEDRRLLTAERFLTEEELDSGIVVRRGETDLCFWHLTFQEYLAARALAGRSEKVQQEILLHHPDNLYSSEWRETVLLLAGALRRQSNERVDAMISAILDRLDDDSPLVEQARCAAILGAVMLDLASVRYAINDPRYNEINRRAMRIFEPNTSVPIQTTIQAAEAIGQVADPRLTREVCKNNWVKIPTGEFSMGAQKEVAKALNYDSEAFDRESPVHQVYLDEFLIARFPVTVVEYERFVEGGGYLDERWWHHGGFRETEQPENWMAQQEHPNRPVVGVSWFEAAAYAEWMNEQLTNAKWICDLPTEAQWERVARGPSGRRYPWGNHDPSDTLLNFDSMVGSPTPVGVYPFGASEEGVHDLAGNVWEWCWDWFGEYSDSPQRNPMGSEMAGGRVLRGGSFFNDAWICRSSYRSNDGPGNRDLNLGFRLAAVWSSEKQES